VEIALLHIFNWHKVCSAHDVLAVQTLVEDLDDASNELMLQDEEEV
jgi:hypothetical protein